MPIVKQAIHEHDVVALTRQVGQWPTGTIGAVVSEHGSFKQIEIADERGRMLDLVSQAEDQLELIAKHS
ncbi:MAG TPA: hypothetical protein VGF95_16115 [Solirubrobacteraceae bacterium]|jgi:hypothetical protein